MRAYYQKTAKQLRVAIQQLEHIAESRDLAEMHRFVVDLKTSLPERVSYENSPLLLEGLRISSIDAMPDYINRLLERLHSLYSDYKSRS